MDTTIQKNCLHCNKVFSKHYNYSRRYWETQRFCSRTCGSSGKVGYWTGKKRLHMTGKNHPMFGKKMSKEWVEKLSKSHEGQHSSPATQFKKGLIPWNKGKPHIMVIGEANQNWKGGVTKLQEKIRKSMPYRQWRSGVFARDNYTCQHCSKRNGKGNGETILNADHVKPFALILSENYIDSFEKAIACEELWNLNNGRTLCLDCHKSTPTYLKDFRKLTYAL